METCSTCKYCCRNELKDMICINGDSEYCSDFVDETRSCYSWEEIRDEDS